MTASLTRLQPPLTHHVSRQKAVHSSQQAGSWRVTDVPEPRPASWSRIWGGAKAKEQSSGGSDDGNVPRLMLTQPCWLQVVKNAKQMQARKANKAGGYADDDTKPAEEPKRWSDYTVSPLLLHPQPFACF